MQSSVVVSLCKVDSSDSPDAAFLLLWLWSVTPSMVDGFPLIGFALNCERYPWLRLKVLVSDCLRKFSKRGCDSRG